MFVIIGSHSLTLHVQAPLVAMGLLQDETLILYAHAILEKKNCVLLLCEYETNVAQSSAHLIL